MRVLSGFPVLMFALVAIDAQAIGRNSDENLKRATAQQVAEITQVRILADSVELYEVKRGMFSVKWKAKTAQGDFACESDDMLQKPYCASLKTEDSSKADPSPATTPPKI